MPKESFRTQHSASREEWNKAGTPARSLSEQGILSIAPAGSLEAAQEEMHLTVLLLAGLGQFIIPICGPQKPCSGSPIAQACKQPVVM